MVLSNDAAPYITTKKVACVEKLNKDILQKIEDDLDFDEKVSILFLMINNYTCGFQEIYNLLQKHKVPKTYIITEFIDTHPENWKSKLLEAICIIQNRQIIRKLGILYSDLELFYLPKNGLCSRNLNTIAKCLYLLCEALTKDKIKLLLEYVKSDLTEYEESLRHMDFLELHMLYWMQQKYISIHSDCKVSLKNLLKHLKRFDDLELVYEDLKKHEDYQNVLDMQNANSASTSQLLNVEKIDVKKMKKGLCIIISQMLFLGEKFETRFGTLADCLKLSETFKGFGFTVEVFNNLKKDEMLTKLEDIPKVFGIDYDCIFVCILSHGHKGSVISSDTEEVSIEAIEHKFCSIELKDVIKVVIIQACQGQAMGQVNDSLAVDGPTNYNTSNLLAYRNFCIFMSTMQGFVSVRHKADGSWFIQELCNVLQNDGCKMTFLYAVRKIIQSVIKKRGKLNGTTIAQLPELRSCRLLTDFQLPKYQGNTR